MNEDHNQMIEDLYNEMFQHMISYAKTALPVALAEEAVQETFRIACQRAEVLAQSETPKGWLIVTLRNTIRNIRRNQESTKRILAKFMATQISDIGVTEDNIGLEVMYQNIADMEDYKLLKEKVLEGKSHAEMADARGITVEACKKRVERAKKSLRKKIEL